MTPAVHPALQRYAAANCTSWYPLSSSSQPPSGAVGVPMISPFSARHVARTELLHAGQRRALERPVGCERSRRLAADVDRHGGGHQCG